MKKLIVEKFRFFYGEESRHQSWPKGHGFKRAETDAAYVDRTVPSDIGHATPQNGMAGILMTRVASTS